MNRTSPRTRRLAELLIGLETVAGNPAAGNGSAAARACEKLRHVLSASLGTVGFRTLFARALALAIAEVPGMPAVQMTADGSFENFGVVERQSNNGKVAKEEIILIAHLLGLLVVFVGETLMLQLVQDAWPKANLDHFYFESEKVEKP